MNTTGFGANIADFGADLVLAAIFFIIFWIGYAMYVVLLAYAIKGLKIWQEWVFKKGGPHYLLLPIWIFSIGYLAVVAVYVWPNTFEKISIELSVIATFVSIIFALWIEYSGVLLAFQKGFKKAFADVGTATAWPKMPKLSWPDRLSFRRVSDWLSGWIPNSYQTYSVTDTDVVMRVTANEASRFKYYFTRGEIVEIKILNDLPVGRFHHVAIKGHGRGFIDLTYFKEI